MENFKFDLTNRQVRLLHFILEDYFTRFAHRAIMIEKMGRRSKHFDVAFTDINSLCVEFDLQTQKYLDDNDLISFVDDEEISNLSKFMNV